MEAPRTYCMEPGWLCTWTGSTVSRTTHRMSKREMIGSVRSTFSEKVSEGSYRPPVTQRKLSGFMFPHILSSHRKFSPTPSCFSGTGEEHFGRGTRRRWRFSASCPRQSGQETEEAFPKQQPEITSRWKAYLSPAGTANQTGGGGGWGGWRGRAKHLLAWFSNHSTHT